MTSLAIIRAQFAFNRAMNERLWTIIMAHLTDAQFAQANGYSQGSIRSQMVHMADAHRFWFRALLGVLGPQELNPEDYPTRESARQICQQIDQEAVARVNAFTEADLERVPEIWSQPVWVALLQLTHHSTDHRAQILRALNDLSAPTFDPNFALFMEYAEPMTGHALSAYIEGTRAKWDEVLRQLPEAKMDQPVMNAWTARDLVAIVTWKARQIVDMIHKRTAIGASFGLLPEAEQAAYLAANRALPLSALLNQHHAVHRDLLEAVRAAPEADLNAEDVPGVPPDERFWKILAGATWWSYPSFTASLRKLL